MHTTHRPLIASLLLAACLITLSCHLAAARTITATPAQTSIATSTASAGMTYLGTTANNNITVRLSADRSRYVIDDVTPIQANAGCTLVAGNDHEVSCLALRRPDGSLRAFHVSGGPGDDSITNLTAASMVAQGGPGQDTLTGGDRADTLHGGDDDDHLTGNGGADLLDGGPGRHDQVSYTARLSDTTVTLDDVANDGANGEGDNVRTSVEDVATGAGDDIVHGDGADNTISTAAGNDRLVGGGGTDILTGGDGNDTTTGGTGDDIVLMGAGDDTTIWNPGDGNDTIEGQTGDDTLQFNGASIGEKIQVATTGRRLQLLRDIGNVVLDADGIDNVDLRLRGGADTTHVSDLSGTAVQHVQADLAGASGRSGDGFADTVTVDGTAGDDVAVIRGDPASGVQLDGLATSVSILHPEGRLDSLRVNGLVGDDVINAAGLSAGALTLTADGGDGDDILIGSGGDDTLLGGNGHDFLQGGPGNDTLDGGPGNNVVIQN